jgi:hypothetical protein
VLNATGPATAMVAGTVLHFLLGQRASRLAILPRTLVGLIGIGTTPFVHSNRCVWDTGASIALSRTNFFKPLSIAA